MPHLPSYTDSWFWDHILAKVKDLTGTQVNQRPHSTVQNQPKPPTYTDKSKQFHAELYGTTAVQGGSQTSPGSKQGSPHNNTAIQTGAGAHVSPPTTWAGNTLEDRRNAYSSALRGQYSVSPPQSRRPTLGTRDLAWAIPALLGALSGSNGRELAGGIIASGLDANRSANDAYNQQRMANWQFGQEKRANSAQVAGLRLQQAQDDADVNAKGDESVPTQDRASVASKVSVAPSQPDFFGRFTQQQIGSKQDEIRGLARSVKADPEKVVKLLAPFPFEVQAKMARRLLGIDAPPQDAVNLTNDDLTHWALEPARNFYEQRLLDPWQSNPLTEEESRRYQIVNNMLGDYDSDALRAKLSHKKSRPQMGPRQKK